MCLPRLANQLFIKSELTFVYNKFNSDANPYGLNGSSFLLLIATASIILLKIFIKTKELSPERHIFLNIFFEIPIKACSF